MSVVRAKVLRGIRRRKAGVLPRCSASVNVTQARGKSEILHLQSLIGNRAVRGLFASRKQQSAGQAVRGDADFLGARFATGRRYQPAKASLGYNSHGLIRRAPAKPKQGASTKPGVKSHKPSVSPLDKVKADIDYFDRIKKRGRPYLLSTFTVDSIYYPIYFRAKKSYIHALELAQGFKKVLRMEKTIAASLYSAALQYWPATSDYNRKVLIRIQGKMKSRKSGMDAVFMVCVRFCNALGKHARLWSLQANTFKQVFPKHSAKLGEKAGYIAKSLRMANSVCCHLATPFLAMREWYSRLIKRIDRWLGRFKV